jgi:hypothetical protein
LKAAWRPAHPRAGTHFATTRYVPEPSIRRSGEEAEVGKGILLWLLGIPLPIILLLLLFWH